VGVPLVLFPLFWFFRSSTFRGDGDQISRLIHGGIWLWMREMLSQAILQAAFRLLQPWHWDGMMTMNLVSCLSGCIFYGLLIQLARERWGRWKLPVFFFLGSGFTILFCGHTEYYAMVFAAAIGFFFSVRRTLAGQGSLLGPALWFSLLCWMHLLGLILLPALLYLWWAAGRPKGKPLLCGLLGLSPLPLLYICLAWQPWPLVVHGELLGDRFLPPFDFNSMGQIRKLYAFGSWHHLHDILYWMLKASPLMLPMAFAVLYKNRVREALRYDSFTIFLTLCGGLWLAWTLVWHPDFTIYQDWDLFAIAGLPLTLLLLDAWIRFGWTRSRWTLVAILALGVLPTWLDISLAARFGHRGRGHLRIISPQAYEPLYVKVDRHDRTPPEIYNILEGQRHLRAISYSQRRVMDRNVLIRPGQWTEVELDWSKARPVDRKGVY